MITIVTYHYVRDLDKSRYPGIKGCTVSHFRKQLAHFEERYFFISIPDLTGALDGETTLPENAMLLTFNDNYIDHFRSVLPVLDEKGISGCFFPETEALAGEGILQNHKIHFILASSATPKQLVQAIFDLLDTYRPDRKLKSNETYFEELAAESAYDSKEVVFIKKLLQSGLESDVSHDITYALFNSFVDVDEEVLAHELYMKPKHIKCMVRHGMHFGIIGHSHKRLAGRSYAEQRDEITSAKKYLIDKGIDAKYLTVSYPWGVFDNTTRQVLREEGIRAAFTGKAEMADLNKHDRYELPRFDTNDFPVET